MVEYKYKDKKYSIVNDWKTAIGLQAVDGLQPSDYLYELAGKHIQGEMDIKEIQRNLKAYYENKGIRNETDEKTNEADKVSANIIELLMDNHFSLTPDEYRSIHESLFYNVFPHAGVYRINDISKKEWVLQYNSVDYGSYPNIIPDLEKAMQEEAAADYSEWDQEDKIEHFADFISKIWKIHPFYEGNTRTTALFAIKYLRSMGFDIDNEIFRQHSWFFRNALARANYSNSMAKIEKDSTHLYHFFKNLLAGTDYTLKNRDILVLPPDGWQQQTTEESSTDISVQQEMKKLGDIRVYKHNNEIHCLKCSIEGIEQSSKNMKMKDLMAYYKLKENGTEEEMDTWLEKLAMEYFKEELQPTDKCSKSCKP